MTAPVPMVPPGPAKINGWCTEPAGYPYWSVLLYYSEVAVNVTSPYRLQVLQGTSVSAGTMLQVNAIGGGAEVEH